MNAGQYSSESQESLTPVVEHVQCAAASIVVNPACESDEAAVQAFIETLARIAQAVAARKAQQEKTEQ